MRALLVDLDDTLYDEWHYVESGFAAVADVLAARCGHPAELILRAMLEELDLSGRGRVFDVVLARYGLAAGAGDVAALVELYRAHRPRLAFYPGTEETLARLRRQHRLAVVTDGFAGMQRSKVAALGLEQLVDTVVYCWDEQAPKPATGGFMRALARLGAQVRDAVVIGDAPHADMAAAAALGVPSIRVRSGRFKVADNLRDALPFAEVSTFTDIEPALERWAAKEIA